jgi:hypothetical protein
MVQLQTPVRLHLKHGDSGVLRITDEDLAVIRRDTIRMDKARSDRAAMEFLRIGQM